MVREAKLCLLLIACDTLAFSLCRKNKIAFSLCRKNKIDGLLTSFVKFSLLNRLFLIIGFWAVLLRGRGELPIFPVSLSSVFLGLFPFLLISSEIILKGTLNRMIYIHWA